MGKLVNVEFKLHKFSLSIKESEVFGKGIGLDVDSELHLGGEVHKVGDFIMHVAKSCGITREVMKNHNKLIGKEFVDIAFIPPPGTRLITKCNNLVAIKKVFATLKLKVDESTISIDSGSYMDNCVAYGQAENVFDRTSSKKIMIAMTKKDENTPEVSLLLPSTSSKDEEVIYNMEVVNEK